MEAKIHNLTKVSESQSHSSPASYRVVWHETDEVSVPRAVSRSLVNQAQSLAREIEASAILVPAEAIENDDTLRDLVESVEFRTILVSRNREAAAASRIRAGHVEWITIPDVHMNRGGQVKVALLVSLAKGLVQRTDRVVCLSGLDGAQSLDACLVLDLESEPELFSAADSVLLSGGVSPAVFERTLLIATQLSAEGREGRPIGALFVIGDSQNVLTHSRPLVLNPFHGYPEAERNILDPNLQETIKEFSAIDGAFIIRGDGVVLAAGRQLLPPSAGTQLLNGLGTRHAAACAVTASSSAVAIVVSQSTGTISIFKSGTMVTDIQRSMNHTRPVV